MRNLKTVLKATLPDPTSLGGRSSVDRDQLLSLLRQLRGDLGRAYWQRAGLSLLVLAVLLAITWRYGNQPALLSGAVSGMGIIFLGALFALQKVADEMACVDMILNLAEELNLEALTEVARRIATP